MYYDTGVLLSLILSHWCRISFNVLPQGWKKKTTLTFLEGTGATNCVKEKKMTSMSFNGPSIGNV